MTLNAYLLPAPENRPGNETPYGRAPFAARPLPDLRGAELKGWYDGLPYGRTTEKLLMIVRAILAHARSRGWIDGDPAAGVERQQVRYSGDYDFYSREEVDALARAAATEQDAAIYLTAAMTGRRRGELIALRWRDVDFPGQAIRVRANYSFGELVTPNSGTIRTVPMIPDVAQALADRALVDPRSEHGCSFRREPNPRATSQHLGATPDRAAAPCRPQHARRRRRPGVRNPAREASA